MVIGKGSYVRSGQVEWFRHAALKHGIRNPETETESRKRKRKRKRNTESVKEGSKRSISKNISNDNKINKEIKNRHK